MTWLILKNDFRHLEAVSKAKSETLTRNYILHYIDSATLRTFSVFSVVNFTTEVTEIEHGETPRQILFGALLAKSTFETASIGNKLDNVVTVICQRPKSPDFR